MKVNGLKFFFLNILFLSCQVVPNTKVEILNGLWAINGELTNLGSSAEGLLLNVRMVNVTFEDLLVTDFDPEVNTESFLAKIADYKKLGINAFTLNLQGGSPGYEGAINSAYSPDGKLKTKYLHRVADVIRICDVQGIVIILGCLYQRQDQVLRDNTAVFQAIKNTASWIKKQQFGNVILEIANEFPHQGFDHEVIRNEDTLVELIQLAKSTHPDLLVSVSGLGNGSLSPKIIEASDFILIHFNNISVQKYEDRINQLMYFHKPIVCNEDDKIGEEGVKALTVAVKNKCSWGYMNKEVNQYIPLEFKGIADDSLVYSKILELVQPQ